MRTARHRVAISVFEHKDEDLMDIFVVGGYLGENSRSCRIVERCEVSVKREKVQDLVNAHNSSIP